MYDVWRFASAYVSRLNDHLGALSLEAIEQLTSLLWDTYQANRTIFLAGNGGSAATASHFATDLGKGTLGHRGDAPWRPFRVIALSDNLPLISAWANDAGFERVFAGQLRALARPGDVLICFSVSGNSPNVVEAVRLARVSGLTTVGLCGMQGGALADEVDLALVVRDGHYGRVEDVHHILCHILASFLHERLRAEELAASLTR